MNLPFLRKPVPRLALIPAVCVLLVAVGIAIHFWRKQEVMPYATIGVFYNSQSQSPQDLEVIRYIIGQKVEEVNATGGIGGRPVRITYLDDKGNADTTLKAVQTSLQDRSLIAYLGCWSSTKAAAVADLVHRNGLAFIGGYSVPGIARAYPNMYTYEVGVDRFAISTYNLVKTKGRRVAFIGNTGDIFSVALLQQMKELNRQQPGFDLALEKWYPNEHKFSALELDQLTDSLQKSADFLILSVNTRHANVLLRNLWQKNTRIPVFSAFIDIPEIDHTIPGYKQAELYDISVFGIPSALNMRTQLLKDRFRSALPDNPKLDFQVGFGALIGDAIGLVQEAATFYPKEKKIRDRITRGLRHFIHGARLYRGWFLDWSFTRDRILASEAVLGWKPGGMEKPILAPYQFLRSDTTFTRTQVLYTNIDLIRLDHISDEDGSFNARFYLEINSIRHVSVARIDFANAARNNLNNEPLVNLRLLRADSTAGNEKVYNYLYEVSGKFFYARNLKDYPFDRQQFTITLQTNSAYAPFLIQPPAHYRRDTVFASPGWQYISNFVGFDQDIIYTAGTFIRPQSHIPYYKFNFTYVLKRVQVDFFLKVLTPLLAILIITYFSVFIPYREFEALCGLQVTALLSAIALYFSTYKPELQNATISDKIFILTYIMITSLIGTSVLIYTLHHRKKERNIFGRASRFYQLYVFPAIVVVFTIYIRWF